jgi:predicted RNase H-like nuclease
LQELLLAHPDAAIAIDIPIGLTETGEPRLCDVQARRFIDPRKSSIFPAPDRRLLQFADGVHQRQLSYEFRRESYEFRRKQRQFVVAKYFDSGNVCNTNVYI